MKIRVFEGRNYYSFDGMNYYDITGNCLRGGGDTNFYTTDDFLNELFCEGERGLTNCNRKEYYTFYKMLYSGMRLACVEDADVCIPEMVIDYLNHLHLNHKALMKNFN